MLSAEDVSNDTIFTISHEHMATETKMVCSCFVCDNVTNCNSIQLRYGQTTHSKTDLPIKLRQLIGEEFMVIVSVHDRLCLACIKLINQADKLEIELDTVRQLIKEQLKAKYQLDGNELDYQSLPDESLIRSNSDPEDIQDVFQNEIGDVCKTVPNDCDKTDKCNEEVTNIEFVRDCENVKEDVVSNHLIHPLSLNENEGNSGTLFTIKGIIREDNQSSSIGNDISDKSLNILVGNEQIVSEINNENNAAGCSSDQIGCYGGESKDYALCLNERLTFTCFTCNREFQTQVMLRQHNLVAHTAAKWLCYFCYTTFNSDDEFQSHMKIHVNHVKIQPKVSSAVPVDELTTHENVISSTLTRNEVRPFLKCKTCEFKTRFECTLKRHERTCWSDVGENGGSGKRKVRDFECSDCCTTFKSRKQLGLHTCKKVVTVLKTNNDVCTTDKKSNDRFECGMCSVSFCDKNDLITHLKCHIVKNNGTGLVDLSNNDVAESDETFCQSNDSSSSIFHCEKCLLMFDKQSLYEEHNSIAHNLIKSVDTNDDVDVDTNKTTECPEMFLNNVEHFISLSNAVVDELNVSSGLLKEDVIKCSNSGVKENVNEDVIEEEAKTGVVSISDLVDTGVNIKCNVGCTNKSGYEKHSVLSDQKHFPSENVMKIDDFSSSHIDDNKHFDRKFLSEKSDFLKSLELAKEMVMKSFGGSQEGNNLEVNNGNDDLSCPNCTFIASSSEQLKEHQVVIHDCTNVGGDCNMVVCKICLRTVEKQCIDDHYQRNHKNIYCNHCSFETKNKRLMMQHIKEHDKINGRKDKEQGYFCQHCNETFKTKKLFQIHEELHPENLKYDCGECNRKFMKERQLKRHHEEVHRDPHCYYCGKEIINLKALKNHEQRHLKDLQNSKQLDCSVCKRVFKTQTGLRHHFATHTGKFKFFCEFCERGFMSRMMMEEHRSRHTKEDRYVCDVCGRKFTFQSTYWIHRKWHDNPLPYKCNFCGRLFRHTSLLSIHRRKHTGERPYKCPYCPQSFSVGGTLKRHLILHTRKYPFICELCNNGFTTKHKYTVHLTKAHNNYQVTNSKLFATKNKELKMAVKEATTNSDMVVTQLALDAKQPSSDNFEFMQDASFTLANMEDDEAANTSVMMPCIMAGNGEENNGLVFEIISDPSLQPISNGISLPESAILPDMWCQ